MTAEHWLSRNFREALGLPDDACQWLLDLWRVIQVFDDMADGGEVDRDELNRAIWGALAAMPANPFFQKNSAMLLPLIMVAILKWQASDVVERDHAPTATSFVWRAGYYDIVLAAVLVSHGPDTAADMGHVVMSLYGECLDDYMKEFNHA